MNWGDFFLGAMIALAIVNFMFGFDRWKRSRQ